MENNDYTIEQCLEMLTGLDTTLGNFTVDPKDTTVLTSMSKQVFKGLPLTDRQYELLKAKLSATTYVSQFDYKGIYQEQYSGALNKTRFPLREIDRSKYVKIVDSAPEIERAARSFFARGQPTEHVSKTGQYWIQIGFPFSKRLILSVESVAKNVKKYAHEQGTRDHYFRLDEIAVYEIVNEFKNKEFVIDQELIDFYEQLVYIKQNETNFLPVVKDGELVNFHPSTEDYLVSTLGQPSVDTIVRYKDRALLHNIHFFDEELLDRATKQLLPLTGCLVNRTSTQVLVHPKEWSLEELSKSLNQLDRFPIMFILSTETALADLKKSVAAVREYVDQDSISVLFRLDNDTNADFNEYIKQDRLNSPVTPETKVVYICKDKLPKPLLKSEWVPSCVVRIGSSRVQTKIDQWTYECDMVIHYDVVATQWAPTYASYTPSTSTKRKIEKI